MEVTGRPVTVPLTLSKPSTYPTGANFLYLRNIDSSQANAAPFTLAQAWFDNPTAGREDVYMTLGYNFNGPTIGRINTNEPALFLQIESYVDNGGGFFELEAHMSYLDSAGNPVKRPWSYRINRTSHRIIQGNHQADQHRWTDGNDGNGGTSLTFDVANAQLIFCGATAAAAWLLQNGGGSPVTRAQFAIDNTGLYIDAVQASGTIIFRPNAQTEAGRFLGATGGFTLARPKITAGGASTGYSVDNTGEVCRVVYKCTMTYQTIAAAAATGDKTIATLPAKTRILQAYADTTTKYIGGAVATCTLQLGISAGGVEVIASHDVFTNPVTKGLADADMGTSMTRAAAIQGGYMPSFTGTTTMVARITTTGANTNALTQGATTFYLVTEVLP